MREWWRNPIVWISGGIAALLFYGRKAEAQPADAQDEAESDAAPAVLQVSVNVKGRKPTVANMKAFAKALREELPAACPGAPVLNKTLKRNVVPNEGGHRIVYTFDATFAGAFDAENPFVRKKVGACILGFAKTTANFGGRIAGIRAERIA